VVLGSTTIRLHSQDGAPASAATTTTRQCSTTSTWAPGYSYIAYWATIAHQIFQTWCRYVVRLGDGEEVVKARAAALEAAKNYLQEDETSKGRLGVIHACDAHHSPNRPPGDCEDTREKAPATEWVIVVGFELRGDDSSVVQAYDTAASPANVDEPNLLQRRGQCAQYHGPFWQEEEKETQDLDTTELARKLPGQHAAPNAGGSSMAGDNSTSPEAISPFDSNQARFVDAKTPDDHCQEQSHEEGSGCRRCRCRGRGRSSSAPSIRAATLCQAPATTLFCQAPAPTNEGEFHRARGQAAAAAVGFLASRIHHQ
jgi:hypothetical protein